MFSFPPPHLRELERQARKVAKEEMMALLPVPSPVRVLASG
jgi:hypothetical protein